MQTTKKNFFSTKFPDLQYNTSLLTYQNKLMEDCTTDLYHKSESIIPALWEKKTQQCDSYPQGGTTDFSNYRPTSILPAASKILERVFVFQLTDH